MTYYYFFVGGRAQNPDLPVHGLNIPVAMASSGRDRF
jgi:hypothetical protein